MSIRKAKTQQLPAVTKTSENDDAVGWDASDRHDDDNKVRFCWSRSWRRPAWILLTVGVTLVAMTSIKVILSQGASTFPGRSTMSSVHVRKVLTESQQKCSVWIAPSSLKGVNGYGTFTTRDLEAGDMILPSHDGLGVPIENFWTKTEPFVQERRDWVRVWKNYWWARGVPDHVAYEGATDAVDYQIGFGSLPNHHCLLESLTIQYPRNAYDDSMVDRYRDPSAGAFSYNMGREFLVTKPLKAGDEIFLNYGYCKHDSSVPSWTANIYMTEDFEAAASLIEARKSGKSTPFTYDTLGHLQVTDDRIVGKLVKDLLPQTSQEFQQLVESSHDRESLTLQIAENSLNHRSPDWIRHNGMCMENVVPRPSTIPLAGQGAFANFGIVKGEIIAAAPLMQIVDKRALYTFSPDGTRNGTQLLMNYCFGHEESSLLLCPNTNAVLINHCSMRTKQCGPNGPNAHYQWSSGWDPTSDDWRKMTLDELKAQSGRGLAFEVVATRNIQKGEEIFIDYGPEWERAWNDHLAKWQPPPRDDSFITAKEANDMKGPIMDDLISHDLRKTIEHPHLLAGCVYWPSEDDDHPIYHEDYLWKNLTDSDIMKQYASDGSMYTYYSRRSPRDYRRHSDKIHWPCTVIRQHQSNREAYVVRIHQTPFSQRTGEMPWHRHNVPRILYNYPRESIHYFKLPFTSDQHLPGVFRQPIGIRDEIFPAQWRNLKGATLDVQ